MWRFQRDLKRYEGVRYDIYPDPLHGASHATVGVGHLLIPGDKHYGHFYQTFQSNFSCCLKNRSADRDPHLSPGRDDLSQQGLSQRLEGRQETLLRGV